MSDLVRRAKAALGKPDGRLWFPELTAELAESGWRRLHRTAGVSPPDYSTSRVIVPNAEPPCRIMARFPIGLDSESSGWFLQVEILGGKLASHYEKTGISFYTSEEIVHINILELLGDAISILKRLPTLYATITGLVKSIHVIKLADDDYDASFSEPRFPFSIFVSVPRQRDEVSALRVAEAVVHESMHLQLTLIELIVPLIKSTNQQYYSPWRGEFRNTQGIIHGLYVFSVIDEFLSSLYRSELAPSVHIERRLSEIRAQIGNIGPLQESEDLTEAGSEFVRRLMFQMRQKLEGLVVQS